MHRCSMEQIICAQRVNGACSARSFPCTPSSLFARTGKACGRASPCTQEKPSAACLNLNLTNRAGRGIIPVYEAVTEPSSEGARFRDPAVGASRDGKSRTPLHQLPAGQWRGGSRRYRGREDPAGRINQGGTANAPFRPCTEKALVYAGIFCFERMGNP